MTAFKNILQDIRTAEAVVQANQTIATASDVSARAARVEAARAYFERIGLHRFLREQAEAMQAERFNSRYFQEGINDRASASLVFVPEAGEALDDRSGGRHSEYSLTIQSYAGGAVNCRMSSHTYSVDFRKDLPLEELTLNFVKQWFERFVKEAFERRKLSDADTARYR